VAAAAARVATVVVALLAVQVLLKWPLQILNSFCFSCSFGTHDSCSCGNHFGVCIRNKCCSYCAMIVAALTVCLVAVEVVSLQRYQAMK